MKLHSTRTPYTNQISRYQEKFVREHAPLKPHAMDTGKNAYYELYQCLRMGTGGSEFASGEVDSTVTWRCPDCGVERSPQSPEWECCPRCGSTAEPEWR